MNIIKIDDIYEIDDSIRNNFIEESGPWHCWLDAWTSRGVGLNNTIFKKNSYKYVSIQTMIDEHGTTFEFYVENIPYLLNTGFLRLAKNSNFTKIENKLP